MAESPTPMKPVSSKKSTWLARSFLARSVPLLTMLFYQNVNGVETMNEERKRVGRKSNGCVTGLASLVLERENAATNHFKIPSCRARPRSQLHEEKASFCSLAWPSRRYVDYYDIVLLRASKLNGPTL